MLFVVGQSLAALTRPAQVIVVSNDQAALTAMEQAAHRSKLGGPHAAEYAGYAVAAEAHEVEYRFARGEAMGELGKTAYQAGRRRLERLTTPDDSPPDDSPPDDSPPDDSPPRG